MRIQLDSEDFGIGARLFLITVMEFASSALDVRQTIESFL